MTEDWPHQTYGVAEVARLRQAGARRICLTSPTGGGKGKIIQRLVELGQPTVLYINRSALFEQTAQRLDDAGLPVGLQASGYAPSIFENVQLAMIQTVARRMKKRGEQPHDAELVLIDEAHAEKSERAQTLINWHIERGATVIGLTATPTGIGHLYDELVIAGTTSELRQCGALVWAKIVAPDEPSLKAYKNRQVKGVLQFADEFKEVMLPVICGRVMQYYHELNPYSKPAVLFAPGVEESVWFTERFLQAGVPWSHIDGERIILNGEAMAASRDNRKKLFAAIESGRTKGVSNRFVLREGLDLPSLYHCIQACTFGSVTAFLQSGGRVLRAHPSLDHVVVQDHGGNYKRHDSLNCDRDWTLEDTDKSLQEKHDEKFRQKEEAEPIVCPKCSTVRRSGVACPSCGFTYKGRKRIVIETDGTLREVHGDAYHKRRVSDRPEDHKLWMQCYWRCRKSDKTFGQARGLFMHLSGGAAPGPAFPLMPKHEADWAMRVDSVPVQRLTPGNPVIGWVEGTREHNQRPLAGMDDA